MGQKPQVLGGRGVSSHEHDTDADGGEHISPESVDTEVSRTESEPDYNVKYWGAEGDGAADDSSPIQAAIDKANSDGGGVVYLPGGDYFLGSKLTLKSNCVLVGDGPNTTIKSDDSALRELVDVTGDGTAIRSLRAVANDSNIDQTIRVSGADHVRIHHCDIESTGTTPTVELFSGGTNSDKNNDVQISECSLTGLGVYFRSARQCRAIRNDLDASESYIGFQMYDDVERCEFSENTIEYSISIDSDDYGIQLGQSIVNPGSVNRNTVRDNKIIGAYTGVRETTDTSSAYNTGNKIENNYIILDSSNANAGIIVKGDKDIEIRDNTIFSSEDVKGISLAYENLNDTTPTVCGGSVNIGNDFAVNIRKCDKATIRDVKIDSDNDHVNLFGGSDAPKATIRGCELVGSGVGIEIGSDSAPGGDVLLWDNDINVGGKDIDENNVPNGIFLKNGAGSESANAEEPQKNWPSGTVVDFTDSGDGSGSGQYILVGGSWVQLE